LCRASIEQREISTGHRREPNEFSEPEEDPVEWDRLVAGGGAVGRFDLAGAGPVPEKAGLMEELI
jgi:hypothetical protein